MKTFFKLAVCVILLSPTIITAQNLEGIEWFTEDYPPYNYIENGIPKGISIDLLLELWKKAGINKTRKDIQFVPWERGVRYVSKKSDTCLFTTVMTNERQNTLGWKFVYPIPQTSKLSNNRIFARKTSKIRFDSSDDLNYYDKKFGVVRGDIGMTLLIGAGVPKNKLDEATDPSSLIKKLEKGRYDVISYGYATTTTKMKAMGVDPVNYEVVFTFPTKPMGFAFYRHTDIAVIKAFQGALDQLYKDGTTDRILKKYCMPSKESVD